MRNPRATVATVCGNRSIRANRLPELAGFPAVQGQARIVQYIPCDFEPKVGRIFVREAKVNAGENSRVFELARCLAEARESANHPAMIGASEVNAKLEFSPK